MSDVIEFTVGPFVGEVHECAKIVIVHENGDEDVFIACDCEYAKSLVQLEADDGR